VSVKLICLFKDEVIVAYKTSKEKELSAGPTTLLIIPTAIFSQIIQSILFL